MIDPIVPEKQSKSLDFRLLFSLIFIAVLAAYFWTSSRYPALNEKALMGGDTPISGLSFDIIYEIFPQSSIAWEIIANTINWIYTNLKGMTFGVLFGASMLTLLSLIKRRAFKSGFANSALGMVIGAPLGVCVNCAMPIALGLHMGRMRLETTLSALLASPTLNVIVVTMSFALLPLHVAVLKLVLAICLILLVVPLLCRFVLREEAALTGEAPAESIGRMSSATETKGITAWIARALAPVEVSSERLGPFDGLLWFVRTYARSFFFVFIITVPMMFAAAVLGAVVATFVSPTAFLGLLPGSGVVWVLLAMVIIAVLASFVPAPIAFDVILTIVLINAGMRSHYAVVALIGLGSFSVYPFIILWKAISLRTAIALWASVVSLAVIAGAIAFKVTPFMVQYYAVQKEVALTSVSEINWPTPPSAPIGQSLEVLQARLSSQALEEVQLEASINQDEVEIYRLGAPLPERSAIEVSRTDPAFARIVGTDIGLQEKGVLSPLRQLGYHMMMSGLAAGDVHNDGWIDVITRRPDHAMGLSLYANIGGEFTRQRLDLGPVDTLEVFSLATADVDGDGWLDLFVSTVEGGEFLFYNEGGSFSSGTMVQLGLGGHQAVASVAFADFDTDGDIDIAQGNWAPRGVSEGWGMRPLHITNQILWNDGARGFETETLDEVPSQTLTMLVSDFDGDGRPDLLKGNDAGNTDEVDFFGPDGVRDTDVSQQPFPYYMWSSMSYDSGDWNNDLITDYYGGQIAMTSGKSAPSLGKNRIYFEICTQFGQDIDWSREEVLACAETLFSNDQVRGPGSGRAHDGCQRPLTKEDRALCAGGSLINLLENASRDPAGDEARLEECSRRLSHIPALQRLCLSLVEPALGRVPQSVVNKDHRGVHQNSNILMTGQAGGGFANEASDLGVHWPGWSWNSQFADLDQDGLQDILVMTGMWLNASSSTSNVFYHNIGDEFADETQTFGFSDIVPSYSFVTFDYDRDGDVDVIRDNTAMRMIVHRNDRPAGPALWVNLRDRGGNSMAIGARVTICVDGVIDVQPGRCQMRDIKASGGFMSSDPVNAHFGLGDAKAVSLIEVKWPDGEVTHIVPDDLTSGEILIRRS